MNMRKTKVLKKHILHGEIAASVLLKLFINGNEKIYATPLTPLSV